MTAGAPTVSDRPLVFATLPVADPQALADATAWGFALHRRAPSSLLWLGLPCGAAGTASRPGLTFDPTPHGRAAHEVASALGRMAPGWDVALIRDATRRRWEFTATRTATLFVLTDDAPGVYHRVAARCDAAMVHFLRHTYGARLARIVNETLSPEPERVTPVVQTLAENSASPPVTTWSGYP